MIADSRGPRTARGRRVVAAAVAGLLGLLGLLAQGALPTPAEADTAPAQGLPTTVSSDALPTVQIDGVVWTQIVVGNTVFVGGNFTNARPAGAAAGQQTVPRTSLLAYNLTTGELISSFAPTLNGQVRSLVASTDGKTLYAVGNFTTVNGQTRNRIAAFTIATGALVTTFKPNVNYSILGVAVSENTVYFGGSFTTVNGVARLAAAAVDSVTGALRPWNPTKSTSGDVRQLVVSPDRSKVILGGNFVTMNGSSTPGYGLAAVDAVTGANLPLPVNSLIRDGDTNSSIMSLVATADGFYGSGYSFNKAQGNLEGAFKADWDGNLVWVEDCHGDSYSVFPSSGALYVAGHPHYCGNVGGFPQTEPTWTPQRGIAFSQNATGTIGRDQYGYYNYEGKPRPTLLNWFPDINTGTFTGQTQGPWSVGGNDSYVLYGGEFTQVNGQAQQGLVRFAKPTLAPNTDGPRLSGAQFVPKLQSFNDGIRISFPANHDRDNERLTYAVIKNGATGSPIYTAEKSSTFWSRPNLSFVDKAVTAGQTYSYKIKVTDPYGNSKTGDAVSVTAAGGVAASPYDAAVLKDGPQSYWPMNEASGTVVGDLAGNENATRGTSTTTSVTGPIPGDGTAYRFAGGVATSTVGGTVAKPGPNVFSAEAWFKTTSTKGGKIIGFGRSASGNSANSDRHVYLGNSGKVSFGVYPGAYKTVSSPTSYNNGQWHHVVATLGVGAMSLYVDGQLVGSRTDVLSGQIFNGYWRVGGDYLSGWPDNPSTGYLAGDVDNAAVYPDVLSAGQVQAHYALASAPAPNAAPTAAFAAEPAGLKVSVDGSGSTDTDGTIASYAWDFGDDSTATGATSSHTYTAAGTYTVRLTVTDDDSATATTTRSVTVAPAPLANAAPTASFTSTTNELAADLDASGSSDADGTVASYAWDFGDDSTGSGATASHAYSSAGTYAVKLTVTDDAGATGTQTKNVTVAPAPPVDAPFITDGFNRTLSSGLGTADLGGAWTVTGGSTSYAVSNGAGVVKLATAGLTRTAYLGSTLRDSTDTTLTLSADKPATGSGVYFNLSGRRVSATEDYRADFRLTSTNKVTLGLSALQGSSTAASLASTVTLPGTIATGDQIKVRMQTFGTSPTTVRAKVWWGSADEPSTWTVSGSSSYAGLQRTGAVGLTTYLSSSTTNAPLNVSLLDLTAKPVTP